MTATDDNYREAIERFAELLAHARQTSLREPAAMTLATVDTAGRPTARMVLLRGFDERGFVFFTNSLSDKGRQIEACPHAALCFYWDPIGEQVRVEGPLAPVSDDESDEYWSTRSRESKIGAWASFQSDPLPDVDTLRQRVTRFEQEFDDRDVPRPDHWFGYRLAPRRIEFWTSRPARLHDRLLYEKNSSGWTTVRLYP